jgi:hypothetical protein
MTDFSKLTSNERIDLFFSGSIPDDQLTDKDLYILQGMVMNAIMNKKNKMTNPELSKNTKAVH